jgi:hypothetical protein
MPRATSYEEWLAMKESTVIDGAVVELAPMRALAHAVMGREETLPDLLDDAYDEGVRVVEEVGAFKGIEL